jgi:hypothetical protein
MHTVKIIAAGFALLAVCLLVGRLVGSAPAGVASAARIFVPLWLVAAGMNMYVGVARAGYSVAEEAPIFAVVFAIPAAVALLIWWRLTHG